MEIYELPFWVGVPLTVFILVFIMNAINLIDGIDGLSASLSFIALGGFFYCFFVEKMKLDIKFKLKRIKERVYVVEFFGKDNALVIGQKGKTLNSFEYLLNSMIKNCKIEIDVEKFKEKRNDTLRVLAKRMAEKVSKTGKTVRLNAMPPRERKVIHEVVKGIRDQLILTACQESVDNLY